MVSLFTKHHRVQAFFMCLLLDKIWNETRLELCPNLAKGTYDYHYRGGACFRVIFASADLKGMVEGEGFARPVQASNL